LLVAPFVVVLTFLEVSAAPAAIVKVALTVVSFTTVTPETVTRVPDTATAVVPVRLVPVRVTVTGGPLRLPEFGEIEFRVGPSTVNVTVLLVAPLVVTLTVLAPSVAPAVIASVAVTVVSFTTVIALAVTPVPETVTAVVPVKRRPLRVTGTLVPRTPVTGLIVESVGPCTVNAPVKVLLAAPFVVTLTFLAVSAAPAVIVKFAVTVVSFTTVTALGVTPAPDTVTAVVPVRFVPVMVTRTEVP